jgi:sulfur relay (sulfurtransferase) DsrF/TusC family protein
MNQISFPPTLKRKMQAIIVLALAFLPLLAKAQGEQALIDFKIKKPNRVDVVTSSEGQFIFSFLNHKQLQLTTVSKKYSFVSAAFELDKSLYRSDYLLTTREDKFHTAYFYQERTKTIQAFQINLAMATTQTTDCGVLPADEDFLTAFQSQQRFYLITVSKSASLFHLWESAQGGPLIKTSFEVQHEKLYQAFWTSEEELNEKKYSDIGIDKISYDLENNLKSAHALNKLYVKEGKLIVTMDEPDQVWVYTIDLNQKKLEEKKLAFALEVGEGKNNKQGNSFLYHTKLFRVTANDEMMNVSMLDIDSIKIEWNQKFFRDLPILIKNGPIITESGSSTPKVIAKTSQYFNKVQSSKIAIAVNEINDQYVLQIGSYEYKQANSPYGNGSGGGYPRMSVGFGGGFGVGLGTGIGLSYPIGGFGGAYGWGNPGYNYGYPGYYPSSAYSYIESTYFYSLIDAISLEHLDLAPPKTLREKLNDYEDQKFKNDMPDLIKVLPLEDNIILMGYYFKSAHKYQLVEIR